MKLERADVALVSAQHAAPSGLVNQDLLDPSTALGDRLRTTLGAACAMTVRDEADPTVANTDSLAVFAIRRASWTAAPGPKTELLQPVPNCRVAPAGLCGDLANGHPGGDEPFKFLAIHGPNLAPRAAAEANLCSLLRERGRVFTARSLCVT